MSLAKKRKEVDITKIRAARMELELKIMEREEDIQRMRDHIAIHDAKEKEIINELKEMANG